MELTHGKEESRDPQDQASQVASEWHRRTAGIGFNVRPEHLDRTVNILNPQLHQLLAVIRSGSLREKVPLVWSVSDCSLKAELQGHVDRLWHQSCPVVVEPASPHPFPRPSARHWMKSRIRGTAGDQALSAAPERKPTYSNTWSSPSTQILRRVECPSA